MAELLVIQREYNGIAITQRRADRYIDATAMCRAHGKLIADYLRLGSTKEFLNALSGSMGIPIDVLVQIITGGPNASRGTWVHPRVALNLAQWCSPNFAVQVSEWLEELLT